MLLILKGSFQIGTQDPFFRSFETENNVQILFEARKSSNSDLIKIFSGDHGVCKCREGA